jgi:hypothetical protein
MYRINREENSISPLDQRSFSSLQLRERQHLQEWIAKHPTVLGEDLLIIQKEFAGFSDTHERLDLLAVDKQGALVIIENKLDDAGRDVTWQALKYASYCSGLSRENIRVIFQQYLDRYEAGANAEDRLCEFLGVEDFQDVSLNKGVSQRIVLVAAHFRKEVTSTVLWLMNHGLRVQCFKTTIFVTGDDLFLNVEQIIPTPEAEEFMIGLAAKAQDEAAGVEAQAGRHAIRLAFWADLLKAMRQETNLFAAVSPQRQNWIAGGSGVSGIGLNFSATRTYGRAEIFIDVGDKDKNEAVLKMLEAHRAEMDHHLPQALAFELLEGKRACRVKCEAPGNVFEREQWATMIEFMVKAMVGMERAFREQEARVRQVLAS